LESRIELHARRFIRRAQSFETHQLVWLDEPDQTRKGI
jgi:hypothetical protein